MIRELHINFSLLIIILILGCHSPKDQLEGEIIEANIHFFFERSEGCFKNVIEFKIKLKNNSLKNDTIRFYPYEHCFSEYDSLPSNLILDIDIPKNNLYVYSSMTPLILFSNEEKILNVVLQQRLEEISLKQADINWRNILTAPFNIKYLSSNNTSTVLKKGDEFKIALFSDNVPIDSSDVEIYNRSTIPPPPKAPFELQINNE